MSNYNIVLQQYRKWSADVRKQADNATGDKQLALLANLQMFDAASAQILNFIEYTAETDEQFDEQLAYPWKSYERMLKFVQSKAYALSQFTPQIGSQRAYCMSDAQFFGFVKEYYALDDKAEVEAEEKKKAEAKAKAEKDALITKAAELEAEKQIKADPAKAKIAADPKKLKTEIMSMMYKVKKNFKDKSVEELKAFIEAGGNADTNATATAEVKADAEPEVKKEPKPEVRPLADKKFELGDQMSIDDILAMA